MGDMPFTRQHPFLGTGPVSTEQYISPDYFDSERERVFAREWLLLCREEMLPNPGDFVVRDIEICNASVIIVRGEDRRIRAFHNVCSHRGMRLQEKPQGSNASFVCRYHGWVYSLEGALRRATAREHFAADLDLAACALSGVHCDSWNGFVNLADKPARPLREFLGRWGDFADGFPFHKADVAATMSCEIRANWKVGVDAFQEFYHAVFLHMKTQRNMYYTLEDRSGRLRSLDIWGPHRRYSAAVNPGYRTPEHAHVEKLAAKYVRNVNSGAREDQSSIYDLCPGINPSRDPHWCWDQTFIFPNTILTLLPGMWIISQFWPIGLDHTRWYNATYTPKPLKASERFAREFGFSHSVDVALEDVGTTEGTTRGLLTGAKRSLFLQDNEIAVRHLLHSVDEYVRGGDEAPAGREGKPAHVPYRVPDLPRRKAPLRPPGDAAVALPAQYADLEQYCATWALPTFAERRERRDASTIEELREFYAALQPRVEEILTFLDRVPLQALSAGERRLLQLCLALTDVALSIEKYDAPGPPNAPETVHFALDTSALD